MFANVVRLEFLKQRRTFLNGMLVFAIFLVCIVVESILRSRNIVEVLREMMGFFALLGIPALAIFTGPLAATQLRSEPNRSAEEPLPFSPVQKVFGAYSTNLCFLLAGSTVFLAAAQLFGSLKEIELSPMVIVLAALQFHLLSFLFSYWINQSVLGTALAGLIIAIEAYIFNHTEMLTMFFTRYETNPKSSFTLWLAIAGVASLVGGLISLRIIAKRVELGIRTYFLPGLGAYLAAIVGAIVLLIGVLTVTYQFQNKLTPNDVMWLHQFISQPNLEATGAYFGTPGGDLIRITADNRQTLVRTPFMFAPGIQGTAFGYDSNSTTWFVVPKDTSNEIYEILKILDDKTIESFATFNSKDMFPTFLIERNGKIRLYGYSEERAAFTEVESGHNEKQSLEWKTLDAPQGSRFSTILTHALQPEIQAGKFASLDSSGMILNRKLSDGTTMQWSLPGKARVSNFFASLIYPAYFKDGKPYFAFTVSENGKTTIVACSPDGSVTPVWNHSWESNEQISARSLVGGGIAWIRWKKEPELLILSNKGIPFAPLSMAPFVEKDKLNWASAIHVIDSQIAFLINDRFLKVDLNTGKAVASVHLKKLSNYYRLPTKEGIYIVKDNRICLIDWNGKIRDLGPASL